jgi:hypothetical protein
MTGAADMMVQDEAAARATLTGVEPLCPRCGYDLSGLAASWRETCPLESVCSECGLEFECRDVLGGELPPPRWMYEYGHVPSANRLARTCLLVVARPAWFWRQVRLAHPIRTRRLIVLGLLMLLVMHLVAVAAAWVLLYRLFARSSWMASPTFGEVVAMESRHFVGALVWPHSVLEASSLFVLVFACAVPLSFLVLGDTMRHCRVRRLHLLRCFVWSLPAVPIVSAPLLLLAAWSEIPPLIMLPALALFPWLAWYWHMVTLRYLKLTHAWAVSLAMLTIGFLSTPVLVWIIMMASSFVGELIGL